MSKLILPLLSLCLTIWLFGGSVWFGNQFSKHNSISAWLISDGKAQFSSPTTFSFQTSDAEIILDDNQLSMISEIAQYMERNPERNLELTGLYTKDEINNSDYKNLGLGRAESFRYLLYRQGIALEKIQVTGNLIEKHQLNSNGLINGGVEFSFTESPISKYGSSFSIIKQIDFMDDYSATFDLSVNYIAALRQYLADYPNKSLQIVVYNISVDDDFIAQKRVKALTSKLSDEGISSNKIVSLIEQVSKEVSKNGYAEIRIL